MNNAARLHATNAANIYMQSAPVTVSNTTTETKVLSFPIDNIRQKNQFIRCGTWMRITAHWKISATNDPGDTCTFRVDATGSKELTALTQGVTPTVPITITPAYGTDQAGISYFHAWWTNNLVSSVTQTTYQVCSFSSQWIWGDSTHDGTDQSPPDDNWIQGRSSLGWEGNTTSTVDWSTTTSIDVSVEWSDTGNGITLDLGMVEWGHGRRMFTPSAFRSGNTGGWQYL